MAFRWWAESGSLLNANWENLTHYTHMTFRWWAESGSLLNANWENLTHCPNCVFILKSLMSSQLCDSFLTKHILWLIVLWFHLALPILPQCIRSADSPERSKTICYMTGENPVS